MPRRMPCNLHLLYTCNYFQLGPHIERVAVLPASPMYCCFSYVLLFLTAVELLALIHIQEMGKGKKRAKKGKTQLWCYHNWVPIFPILWYSKSHTFCQGSGIHSLFSGVFKHWNLQACEESLQCIFHFFGVRKTHIKIFLYFPTPDDLPKRMILQDEKINLTVAGINRDMLALLTIFLLQTCFQTFLREREKLCLLESRKPNHIMSL